jgi:DNA-binding MarR family transcriptional regulator
MDPFTLHKEFLRMQRRMRLLRIKNPGSLSPRVSLALTILAKQPEMTPNELADFLRIDQGNLSRLLSSLENEGFLKLVRSSSDGRSKRIVFTPKGNLALSEASKLNHYLAKIGMTPLADFERERVGRGFAKISSGLRAKEVKQLEGEELFVSEQMRLLRTLGMIGSSYLGSEWDVGTYQIFNVLSEEGELPFAKLKQVLPIEQSIISREVTRQCGLNLLRKVPDPHSAKGVMISLTANGRKRFNKNHEQATNKIALAISDIPESDLEDLVSLLKIAGTGDRPNYNFRKCVSAKDYFRARAILVERLVQKREHLSLASEVLPETLPCVLIERAGDVVGLVAAEGKKFKWLELPEVGSENDRQKLIKEIRTLLS